MRCARRSVFSRATRRSSGTPVAHCPCPTADMYPTISLSFLIYSVRIIDAVSAKCPNRSVFLQAIPYRPLPTRQHYNTYASGRVTASANQRPPLSSSPNLLHPVTSTPCFSLLYSPFASILFQASGGSL